VQGLIAGGRRALTRAVEGAEDSAEAGAASIDGRRLKPHDVVVGIAACGITPFVCGALERARQIGARAILLTCAPQGRKYSKADIVINPAVGPEVVTGSTRMKAGTATKLVLNTLTTASMIRLGKVYSNLMVDLRATNEKLRDRAERIVSAVTGLPRSRARRLLAKADGRAKAAIVMHFRKASLRDALTLLRECDDSLRMAIE
jgi:N-acetylmuramic acid 6-phosphate etherase